MPLRTKTDFEYDPKSGQLDRPSNRWTKERLNASRADEAVGEHRRQRQHTRETAKIQMESDALDKTGGEQTKTKTKTKAQPKVKTQPLSEMDKARAAANKQNIKIDKKANSFLRKPRTITGGVKALARGGMNVGKAALSVPAIAGYATNELAREYVRDTEGAQAIQTGIADKAADLTGVTSLEERLMSDDPEVARAAIAEEKQQRENPSLLRQANNWFSDNIAGKRGEDSMLMDGLKAGARFLTRPGDKGEGGPANTAQAPGTEEQDPPVPGSPQVGEAPIDDNDAMELGVLGQSRPANVEVNAGNPEDIANSSYQFAGKYGDTNVITRPAVDGQGQPYEPNSDGSAVPEFTDPYTAQGLQRPAQSQEALAEENRRVEQAREDYQRNTTMSDGRRAFGGQGMDELREIQLADSRAGRNREVIDRQLQDEGRTPEQRAAYAADPSGAYNVDAQAQASLAQSELASFKENFNMAKASAQIGDRRTTEQRRSNTDEAGKIDTAFADLELSAPLSRVRLTNMANKMVESGQGSAAEVLDRIYSSIQFDENNIPMVDPETGEFMLTEGADLEAPALHRPENDVHL